MRIRGTPAALAMLAAAGPVVAQTDSFHLMQIEQVIGGVSGDVSAQAIQLRMRSNGQSEVQGRRLVAYDANGLNPVTVITFPTGVTNAVAGDRILIASAMFASQTSPTCVPDFVMANLIPASYLPAGRLCFQNGATILWSLAWGGQNYLGSNLGAVTNDPDGNFGPAFAGALPSGDDKAVIFTRAANAQSTTNAADYALTSTAAVFTSNARDAFTVTPFVPCYADCDTSTGLGVLDIFDFLCFQNAFAASQRYACECDTSTGIGVCDIFDFLCFQNAFAAGCP